MADDLAPEDVSHTIQTSEPNNRMQVGPISQGDRFLAEQIKKAVQTGLRHFAPEATVEVLVSILEQEHSVDFELAGKDPGIIRAGLAVLFGVAEPVVEARIAQSLAALLSLPIVGRSLEEILADYHAANGLGSQNRPH